MKHILRLLAIVLFLSGVSASSSANAQTEIMKGTVEKVAASFKKLELSCGEDVKKYCSTVTPGEGRLLYCMQAHEDKISNGCASVLDEVALQIETTAELLQETANACRGDIDRLCAKVPPGQGRIAVCLAANKTSISKSCEDSVQKFQNR
jgi:Cysteine rich repeat